MRWHFFQNYVNIQLVCNELKSGGKKNHVKIITKHKNPTSHSHSWSHKIAFPPNLYAKNERETEKWWRNSEKF